MIYQETIKCSYWINILKDQYNNMNAPTLATDGVKIPDLLKGKYTVMRIRHQPYDPGTYYLYYWTLWGYVPKEVDATTGAAIANSAGWSEIINSDPTKKQQLWFSFYESAIDQSYVFLDLTVFDRIYFRLYGQTLGRSLLNVSMCFTC